MNDVELCEIPTRLADRYSRHLDALIAERDVWDARLAEPLDWPGAQEDRQAVTDQITAHITRNPAAVAWPVTVQPCGGGFGVADARGRVLAEFVYAEYAAIAADAMNEALR